MSDVKIKKFFDGDVNVSQEFGEHPEVYSRYGLKGHNGIDFKLPIGTRVVPGCECTVIKDVLTIEEEGYGNHVVAIATINGKKYHLVWAHLDAILLPGKNLLDTSVIGLSGNSGALTEGGQILPQESAKDGAGAHLHFGMRQVDDGGKVVDRDNGYDGYIDPAPFLDFIKEKKKKKESDAKDKQGGDQE